MRYYEILVLCCWVASTAFGGVNYHRSKNLVVLDMVKEDKIQVKDPSYGRTTLVSNIADCVAACLFDKECGSFHLVKSSASEWLCSPTRYSMLFRDPHVVEAGAGYTNYALNEKCIEGTRKMCPATSCKHARSANLYETLKDGFYWITITEESVTHLMQMYCAMDISVGGGGWTQIANIDTRNGDIKYPKTFSVNDIKTLSNVNQSYYALGIHAVATLRDLINFTQIRFYCHKTSPNRTIDITTKSTDLGFNVVDFLLMKTDNLPKACGSFAVLPDDNSFISGLCHQWNFNSSTWHRNLSIFPADERLYSRIFFVARQYHYIAGDHENRYECDDTWRTGSDEGVWKYYVK